MPNKDNEQKEDEGREPELLRYREDTSAPMDDENGAGQDRDLDEGTDSRGQTYGHEKATENVAQNDDVRETKGGERDILIRHESDELILISRESHPF